MSTETVVYKTVREGDPLSDLAGIAEGWIEDDRPRV